MTSELTPKQERFVEEYLIDLNGKQAAIRAGYSPDSAEVQASRLLSIAKVAAAVEAGKAKLAERTGISQDYVLKGIRQVAERCLQEIKPVLNMRGQQVTDEEGNPLYAFNANGANRAFELLGKHLGMFVDKTEITGKDGGPIVTQTKEQRDAAVAAALAADS